MLRPSYAELMDVLNKETEGSSEEVTSRYTIVIAAAKRARQLIDGDEPMVPEKKGKPLSTAVDELYHSKIKVVPEGEGTVLNLKKDEELNLDILADLKANSKAEEKEEVLDFSEEDEDEF